MTSGEPGFIETNTLIDTHIDIDKRSHHEGGGDVHTAVRGPEFQLLIRLRQLQDLRFRPQHRALGNAAHH